MCSSAILGIQAVSQTCGGKVMEIKRAVYVFSLMKYHPVAQASIPITFTGPP